MSEHKWMDQAQPQTLQAAVMLCYINAVLAVLFFLVGAGAQLFLLLLLGAAGYFIANDRRWAYWAGIAIAGLYVVAEVAAVVLGAGFAGLFNLLFAVVLFVLLVHRDSRAYQKVWFH